MVSLQPNTIIRFWKFLIGGWGLVFWKNVGRGRKNPILNIWFSLFEYQAFEAFIDWVHCNYLNSWDCIFVVLSFLSSPKGNARMFNWSLTFYFVLFIYCINCFLKSEVFPCSPIQGLMAKASAGVTNSGNRNGVRIVVAGDRGTGKSSLIVTAAAENFPANVPPVLPPTRLPDDFYPDRVPITIIDTSSR